MDHPISDALNGLASQIRALEDRLMTLEAQQRMYDYIAAIKAGWDPVSSEVCTCCNMKLILVGLGKYGCPNCQGRC